MRTPQLTLAIFDLDHTLLAGDSDYAWGQFLIERGVVARASYERENERYYAQYRAGSLDIFEFLAFALEPLTRFDRTTLDRWHGEFMREKILPMITPNARSLVARHRNNGDTLLVITATNSFVTRPIVTEFGIGNLLATEPEVDGNGRFTGHVAGIPCFREGKVKRLEGWLEEKKLTLDGSYFYSDSHNDLPLLCCVTHPVAVNPDTQLRAHAEQNRWPILNLHGQINA